MYPAKYILAFRSTHVSRTTLATLSRVPAPEYSNTEPVMVRIDGLVLERPGKDSGVGDPGGVEDNRESPPHALIVATISTHSDMPFDD
jgi:hypothetical protein